MMQRQCGWIESMQWKQYTCLGHRNKRRPKLREA